MDTDSVLKLDLPATYIPVLLVDPKLLYKALFPFRTESGPGSGVVFSCHSHLFRLFLPATFLWSFFVFINIDLFEDCLHTLPPFLKRMLLILCLCLSDVSS